MLTCNTRFSSLIIEFDFFNNCSYSWPVFYISKYCITISIPLKLNCLGFKSRNEVSFRFSTSGSQGHSTFLVKNIPCRDGFKVTNNEKWDVQRVQVLFYPLHKRLHMKVCWVFMIFYLIFIEPYMIYLLFLEQIVFFPSITYIYRDLTK